jgi:acetyltransferase-like isoleucine patch superfamily enzyme
VISGYCEIGEFCFLGVNSTYNDHVKVADQCVIGSGALITRDTEPNRIYVGSASKAVPGKLATEVDL